jgi:hypothetical protein
MSDKPDLAAIIAEIICEGLCRTARTFHNRKVVFVDDEREINLAIREAVKRLSIHADPVSDVGWSPKPKASVSAVIQKILLERDDGH